MFETRQSAGLLDKWHTLVCVNMNQTQPLFGLPSSPWCDNYVRASRYGATPSRSYHPMRDRPVRRLSPGLASGSGFLIRTTQHAREGRAARTSEIFVQNAATRLGHAPHRDFAVLQCRRWGGLAARVMSSGSECAPVRLRPYDLHADHLVLPCPQAGSSRR